MASTTPITSRRGMLGTIAAMGAVAAVPAIAASALTGGVSKGFRDRVAQEARLQRAYDRYYAAVHRPAVATGDQALIKVTATKSDEYSDRRGDAQEAVLAYESTGWPDLLAKLDYIEAHNLTDEGWVIPFIVDDVRQLARREAH